MELSMIDTRYPTNQKVDEIVTTNLGVYSEVILLDNKITIDDVKDKKWNLQYFIGTQNSNDTVKGVEYLFEKDGLFLYFREENQLYGRYVTKIMFEPKRLGEVELFIKTLKRLKK